MKYKNKVKALKAKQAWWDNLPQREKDPTTRPGYLKTKKNKELFLILLAIIIVICYYKYDPCLDVTVYGDILLWYNTKGGRDYVTLKRSRRY